MTHRARQIFGPLGLAWLLLVLALSCAHAQPTAREMVQGSTGAPVDLFEVKRCHLGTAIGATCATDSDCPGSGTAGRCQAALLQIVTVAVPPWALARNEVRDVDTSAVDAFSTPSPNCWAVRVQNVGQTILYVGWSGVTTSSYFSRALPGEYAAPMYPPSRDCNAVKIISSAADGAAAVGTP